MTMTYRAYRVRRSPQPKESWGNASKPVSSTSLLVCSASTTNVSAAAAASITLKSHRYYYSLDFLLPCSLPLFHFFTSTAWWFDSPCASTQQPHTKTTEMDCNFINSTPLFKHCCYSYVSSEYATSSPNLRITPRTLDFRQVVKVLGDVNVGRTWRGILLLTRTPVTPTHTI